MNNIQITYKAITLPERVYFKSENNRHEKLKNYLQEVVKIHDIGKVYALNTFFNIEGNEVEQIS
jgi:CRISPR/Cas system-associated endonuclease Cas3-HD